MFYNKSFYAILHPKKTESGYECAVVEILRYYPSGHEEIVGIQATLTAVTKSGAARRARRVLKRLYKNSRNSEVSSTVGHKISIALAIFSAGVAATLFLLR